MHISRYQYYILANHMIEKESDFVFPAEHDVRWVCLLPMIVLSYSSRLSYVPINFVTFDMP